MSERWWFAIGIAAVLGLGAHARLWPAAPAPALRDAHRAERWMVDALPGVGQKRLDEAYSAVRSGDFGALPAPARICAEHVFKPPAAEASPRQ
jgi:hypothetical protein